MVLILVDIEKVFYGFSDDMKSILSHFEGLEVPEGRYVAVLKAYFVMAGIYDDFYAGTVEKSDSAWKIAVDCITKFEALEPLERNTDSLGKTGIQSVFSQGRYLSSWLRVMKASQQFLPSLESIATLSLSGSST